ncbi:MAG: hypothetical protein HN855_07130 [Anaerolineae bacterium]|jgi:hypothetical protein|nr:hypothetical protein [Anaerolineae bacterium]MBT7072661.1 hypothetical protein [Anaerolineae bacterium]MBT7324912.1 hypothetical protein [Anaerolineae bacterium]
MKRWTWLLCLSLLLLAGCAQKQEVAFVPSENLDEMVIPQIDVGVETQLPVPFDGTFSIYGDTPVLYSGLDDAWDSSLVFPGAVIYRDGLYHMFYNGLTFTRGLDGGGIGYAISTNGFDWFRVADAPLFTWDETIGEASWLRASSALIEEDGTWVLYLSSASRGVIEDLPMIWRATAPAPNGPWTFDDTPLLEPGETGAWDDYGVEDPIVLKTGSGYFMYYLNARFDNQRGITAVGLATSNDGLFWTKYNDPNTDERYSVSDPVFLYNGEISGYDSIQTHFVWQDQSGFAMLYGVGRNTLENLNYATSADGTTWTIPAAEPVFTIDDVDFLSTLSAPKVFINKEEYFIYFYGSADNNRPIGNIYLASAGQ